MKITEAYKEVVETIVKKVSVGKSYRYEKGDAFYFNKKGTSGYGRVAYISAVDDRYRFYMIEFLPNFERGYLSMGFEKEEIENGELVYLGKFSRGNEFPVFTN